MLNALGQPRLIQCLKCRQVSRGSTLIPLRLQWCPLCHWPQVREYKEKQEKREGER